MRKLFGIFMLVSAGIAAQAPTTPQPATTEQPAAEPPPAPKLGEARTFEFAGSVAGAYSSGKNFSTNPTGNLTSLQIAFAPTLNIFVGRGIYFGGGPNFTYNKAHMAAGAAETSIMVTLLGPQANIGKLWQLTETLYLNTRVVATAQVPVSWEYKNITMQKPYYAGGIGGEILLQRAYEKVLLNVGVQFIYTQYLAQTQSGLLQSEFTTRLAFGFSFWTYTVAKR